VLRALVEQDDERAKNLLRDVDPMLRESMARLVIDSTDGPIGQTTMAVVSPDGSQAVFASDGGLIGWNLETGKSVYESFDAYTVSLAIDNGARRVVAGSRSGTLRLWDLATGQTTMVVDGHHKKLIDIVVTPDDRRVITASADDTIRIWELDTFRECGRLEGLAEQADAVAINATGEFAYSVCGDAILVAHLNPCTRLGSLSLDHKITAITVAGDGRRLALGDESGRVHFLRLNDSAKSLVPAPSA
jgi:WD40 repeat protein